MTRIVVDTNLIVSGLLWSGPPFRIMQLAREGRIRLLATPRLIAELEDVFKRHKLAKRLDEIGKTPESFIAN